MKSIVWSFSIKVKQIIKDDSFKKKQQQQQQTGAYVLHLIYLDVQEDLVGRVGQVVQ